MIIVYDQVFASGFFQPTLLMLVCHMHAKAFFNMKWHLKLATAVETHVSLADAVIGEALTVDQIIAPAGAPEWAGQLEDIGFMAGERVAIMARGMPGGDPLVVRVGLSTFALRLVEAACIRCTRLTPLTTKAN